MKRILLLFVVSVLLAQTMDAGEGCVSAGVSTIAAPSSLWSKNVQHPHAGLTAQERIDIEKKSKFVRALADMFAQQERAFKDDVQKYLQLLFKGSDPLEMMAIRNRHHPEQFKNACDIEIVTLGLKAKTIVVK